MNCVRVLNLGRKAYRPVLEQQGQCVERLLNSLRSRVSHQHPNTLIIVEHDPVYTIGIRSSDYSKEEEERLKSLGADFIRSNRGGLITFHGHGQLVAYPILYLGDFDPEKSVKNYVHKLEETLIKTCTNIFREESSLKKSSPKVSSPKVSTIAEYPGVWIEEERKIAAIGIREQQSVTMHGVALNCNTDMEWYDHIIPCGIEGKGVTSISHELGSNFTISHTLPYFFEAFRQTFNCDLVNGSDEDEPLDKLSGKSV